MSEGMFPQHPKSGDWETLKGRMLTPPELPYADQGGNANDGRVDSQNATGVSGSWDSHVVVSTPLTHGGGTIAK